MRHWMTIIAEATRETANIYAHVSPGKNLRAILKQGLVPNANQGNYSANYWEALDGVYVTRDTNILSQHIRARDMTNDYIIALVQVGGETFIDEDTIDDMLQAAFDSVMRKHGLSNHDVDEIEEITPEIVTTFSASLGKPDPTVLAEDPEIVTEFVDAWIVERIYGGEGPDPDWWPYAKGLLVRAFQHIPEGRALRIPHKIGYTGATRIVGIVHVTHGNAKVVKGTVPASASELVVL